MEHSMVTQPKHRPQLRIESNPIKLDVEEIVRYKAVGPKYV